MIKNQNLLKYIIMSSLMVMISITLQSSSYAASSSASNQATATVAAVCTISAQNLNFGNLVLPLSAQSASTNMTVLCSKNHSYTVGMAYGGVYGQGQSQTPTSASVASYCATSTTDDGGYYTLYNAYNASGSQVASVYGAYTLGLISISTLKPGQCASPTTAGKTLTSSDGKYGPLTFNAVTVAYAYGKMIGVAKGDNVAYSIQVPGNPGQVWNTGENNYTSTGTGSNQTIPVVGTLVPAQSSGNYPTPDYYMDTVTATVSF
jgi:spore coat protein U-like protein